MEFFATSGNLPRIVATSATAIVLSPLALAVRRRERILVYRSGSSSGEMRSSRLLCLSEHLRWDVAPSRAVFLFREACREYLKLFGSVVVPGSNETAGSLLSCPGRDCWRVSRAGDLDCDSCPFASVNEPSPPPKSGRTNPTKKHH